MNLLINVLAGVAGKVLEPVGELILGKVIGTEVVTKPAVVTNEDNLERIPVAVEKVIRSKPFLGGSRTVIVSLALALGPAALQWAGGFDWSQYVSVPTATMISGGAMLLLRIITAYSGK